MRVARRWFPSTARFGANDATGGGKPTTSSAPVLVQIAGLELLRHERPAEHSNQREAVMPAAYAA